MQAFALFHFTLWIVLSSSTFMYSAPGCVLLDPQLLLALFVCLMLLLRGAPTQVPMHLMVCRQSLPQSRVDPGLCHCDAAAGTVLYACGRLAPTT